MKMNHVCICGNKPYTVDLQNIIVILHPQVTNNGKFWFYCRQLPPSKIILGANVTYQVKL